MRFYNGMLKRRRSLLFVSVVILIFSVSCNSNEKYKNTALPFEQRVEDLVSRMTLEEKVSQLSYESAEIARLGIPEYNWWNECLHGVGRAGIATVFPQAIGMAAMWDNKEMFEIASAVSDEARAKHHDFIKQNKRGIYQGLTYWTPNINIFRDPRWGRGMETYGEDPFLTGELGVAYIKGLQGDDPKYLKLVATAKHFAVHSGPEALRHSFDVTPEQYDFIETYTPQFKKVVQEAGVYSVMCAYNRYNGLPCCGNKDLENLLRKDWGFEGYIVSDCWAVRDFYEENAHEIVNTKAEAAAMSVQAGTDLNCGDSYPALIEAVEKEYILESEIDIALKRILLARMKLGMFDPESEVPFASIPLSIVDSKEHQKLALDAARKSIVLLRNEGNLLPFNKEMRNIAVIGPNADDLEVLLGNYNGYSSSPKTPLTGIKEKLPNANVVYAQGCALAEGMPQLTAIPGEVLFVDSAKTATGLKGEYFNNTELEGQPTMVRNDNTIDFEWWANGPGGNIDGNTFSVRWSGVIVPKVTGEYALGGEGFSGFNLWIDDNEFIQFKDVHHPRKQYEYIRLEAGRTYNLRLEYVQNKTEYALMRLLWQEPGKNLKEDAIQLAQNSDLVILCMGLSPLLEGEEMKVKVKGFAKGDREDIQLPETQTELIKAIHKLGKPTVLVLLNGSALAFNWEAENIPAIIEAWYPGQAGGTAIADVIFGDYNPSGRLPVTFYSSIDQLPPFDDYRMEGRTYRYFKGIPLYEFGYGLSYTTFEYSDLIVPEEIMAGEDLPISVKITNVGKMAGEEVVQLYISHPNIDFKVPVRTLKGFERVSLDSGESMIVNFTLTPDAIAILNQKNNYVITGEALSISVGGKQPDPKAIAAKNVVNGNVGVKLIDGEYIIPVK